jgi:hypothetical protein
VKRSSKWAFATLSILLFSSLLVLSFTATPARAADYTKVGVKVGDWAYYSADTNLTGVRQELYINLTVTKIDRSNVTGTWTSRFPNGTSGPSQVVWGNISSGAAGPPGAIPLLWYVMVPNLGQGDPVFVGSSVTVNDTGTMVAAGAARVYVHVNVTVSGGSQDFRMDQATGIGIQAYVLVWTGPNYQYIRWSLNSTSLWSPQAPFPLALLLAVGGGIAAIAVVAAVVVWRRRGRK